jgi:hypothetical protein
VARLAGVLAIAVIGIVMLKIFSRDLDRSLPGVPVAAEAKQEIRSRQIELAGMELPKNLDPAGSAALKNAVSTAFLAGFRIVLFSSAALAIGSAGVASVMVSKK